MKQNTNKYEELQELPANALTVEEYAKNNSWTISNVYMRLLRGKADFKIVIFKKINFVIPL